MEDKTTPHETYMAYMLRLWQAGSREGRSIWRASLENPHTGERQAFGDVEALVAFLAVLTNSADDIRSPAERIETAAVDADGGPPATARFPLNSQLANDP